MMGYMFTGWITCCPHAMAPERGGEAAVVRGKQTVTESRGWSLSIFRDGLESAKAGKPVSTNPYQAGSDHAEIWRGGWQLGQEMYPATMAQ